MDFCARLQKIHANWSCSIWRKPTLDSSTHKNPAKNTQKKTIERAERKGRALTLYDMNGHPKFKSVHTAKCSMPTPAANVKFKNGKVTLVKIGKVAYTADFDVPQGKNTAKICNPRIRYENGKWVLTFSLFFNDTPTKLNDYCVGVDLGVKTLATISCDGQKLTIPNINKTKYVEGLCKRLRREQRKVSRRVDGSNNQKKARDRVRKIYARIRNIRENHNHHATHKIVSLMPKAIGIESLNVSGMMKNRRLSKAIQDCNFYEIRRQLEYKAERHGIKITVADRFYPSSKLCSKCGHKHRKLTLRDRVYICENCGLKIDRDFNAALNLEGLARRDL